MILSNLDSKDDFSKINDNLLLSLFEDLVIDFKMLPCTSCDARKQNAAIVLNNVRAEILKRLTDKTRILRKTLTVQQIEAGNNVASEMYTASIQKAIGLGGCEEIDMNKFKFKNIVKRYLDGDIDSVTGIWLAMEGE